jgi:hypothetical protein
MNVHRLLPLPALLLAAGCADLFVQPERVPAGIVLSDSSFLLAEGSSVRPAVTVVDAEGRPVDVPAWAAPVWTTADGGVAAFEDGALVARGAGRTEAAVRVGEWSAVAEVRVNPARLRLSVHAIQLTQSAGPAQFPHLGSSPVLVAGRDAMLRVHLLGDRTSFFAPLVRVRVFHGAAERETLTVSAAAIPTEFQEGRAERSWNLFVPGALVAPGMRILVEADPQGIVPLAAGSTARFPADGLPLAVDVRTVPPFLLRVVPVRQGAGGTAGNVNAGNLDAYMAPLLRMFPVRASDVELRAPYTTSAQTTTSAGWSLVLREIAALRELEGSERYYYGVVAAGPGGIAGLGYVGWPAAIGYDRMPDAPLVLAHELGHNFGRWHAPCGGPSGVDQSYPNPDGRIDTHGYDVAGRRVMERTEHFDLMSYCGPEWISNYTWREILAFRNEHDWPAAAPAAGPEPALLVWGSIGADGTPALEPAFEVDAAARLPRAPGPYRVEGRDAAGRTLFSLAFGGHEVADGADGERHFAFVVPRGPAMAGLAELRLSAGARTARHLSTAVPGRIAPEAPRFSVAAPAAGSAPVLSWSADRHPVVLVRDARTGQVLSFARGGRVEVPAGTGEVELLFSDGVRTTARRATLPPR